MILVGDAWQGRMKRARVRRATSRATGAAASVTVIADSTMTEPCSGERFSQFSYPMISAGAVAFLGQNPNGKDYRTLNGQLTCIVRPGDTAPDGGTFKALDMPMINAGTSVFWAQTTQHTGIYARTGSSGPAVVVNDKTPIPGKPTSFASFDQFPVVELQQYAFIGYGDDDYAGVFVSDAVVAPIRIADTETAIPGGSGNFSFLAFPSISTAGVAFFGSASSNGVQEAGIYRGGVVPLQALVDLKTSAPDGGTFAGFGAPDIAGDLVAFRAATSSGNQGVYAVKPNSAPITIADYNTAVPGGSGTFNAFDADPAAADGMIAFRAESAAASGIYLWNGTSLTKVVDTTDTINGVGITYLGFGTNGLSQGQVAFYAYLENDVFGIYTMAAA